MNALDLLTKELSDTIQSMEQIVSSGACKDFADYQNKCGYVNALVATRDRVKELNSNEKYGDGDKDAE